MVNNQNNREEENMDGYVQTCISMNKTDRKDVAFLKKNGHKVIDIFRAGINDLKARTPKKLFR